MSRFPRDEAFSRDFVHFKRRVGFVCLAPDFLLLGVRSGFIVARDEHRCAFGTGFVDLDESADRIVSVARVNSGRVGRRPEVRDTDAIGRGDTSGNANRVSGCASRPGGG